MREPWQPGETPEEEAARREAYERLSAAARRVGLPLERLGDLLRQVARNETETRRFLAEEVYGVPDPLLDDLLRVRLAELRAGDDDPAAS
jgi:8-oxo-dGTP pyrophosphatase MutT (NUDIX family)